MRHCLALSLMFLKLSRRGAIVNSTKPCKIRLANEYVLHLLQNMFICKKNTYDYTLSLNINSCQADNLMSCKQSRQNEVRQYACYLTNIILSRLTSYIDKIVGDHLCNF